MRGTSQKHLEGERIIRGSDMFVVVDQSIVTQIISSKYNSRKKYNTREQDTEQEKGGKNAYKFGIDTSEAKLRLLIVIIHGKYLRP